MLLFSIFLLSNVFVCVVVTAAAAFEFDKMNYCEPFACVNITLE